MMIDKQIQKVHDFLTGKEIRWHDFSEVGIWKRLYIVNLQQEG